MKQTIFVICITLATLTTISACTKDSLKQVEDVCTQMDDITFMNYCYKNFDVNNDGMVSMTEANAVKKLYVSNKDIYSLKGIEYFSYLTELDCSYNNLSGLDVSKNTLLMELDCRSNNLTTLVVSNNTQLTFLCCRNNRITSLDISALSKLDRNYSLWGLQKDKIVITITDKKEYWHSLPDVSISRLCGIQWIWL